MGRDVVDGRAGLVVVLVVVTGGRGWLCRVVMVLDRVVGRVVVVFVVAGRVVRTGADIDRDRGWWHVDIAVRRLIQDVLNVFFRGIIVEQRNEFVQGDIVRLAVHGVGNVFQGDGIGKARLVVLVVAVPRGRRGVVHVGFNPAAALVRRGGGVPILMMWVMMWVMMMVVVKMVLLVMILVRQVIDHTVPDLGFFLGHFHETRHELGLGGGGTRVGAAAGRSRRGRIGRKGSLAPQEGRGGSAGLFLLLVARLVIVGKAEGVAYLVAGCQGCDLE